MAKQDQGQSARIVDRQRAAVTLTVGRAELTASAELTSAGLLSIGALVSAILLSTAVLVGVATGGRRLGGGHPVLPGPIPGRDSVP